MSVYVVQRECGDYYCGCGNGHIIGVFTARSTAEAVVKDSLFDHVTEIPVDQVRWQDAAPEPDYIHGWT